MCYMYVYGGLFFLLKFCVIFSCLGCGSFWGGVVFVGDCLFYCLGKKLGNCFVMKRGIYRWEVEYRYIFYNILKLVSLLI